MQAGIESSSLAVLWDMDGTLVDTEPLWMAAQRRLADGYGVEWTDVDAHSTVGKSMPDSAGMLRTRGVDLPVGKIIERLVADVSDTLDCQIPWLPGAQRLLSDLTAAAVPCALVTMAYGPVARRVAAVAPGDPFQTVIAGDDVARGKPFPDPYLAAAASLGIEPQRCVAIEDSLNGTLSAEAAGIPVLVVPGLVDVPHAPTRHFARSLCDVTPDTLRDIAACLRKRRIR
jgi:beta-phosphoglucomutase-like phosphatase (HAD superfamily)